MQAYLSDRVKNLIEHVATVGLGAFAAVLGAWAAEKITEHWSPTEKSSDESSETLDKKRTKRAL